MTQSTKSAKSIVRAWFLIKVQNVDKAKLAKDIYKQVNNKYTGEEKVFVVRADVVDGPYDLIVPVFTGTFEELAKVETFIKSLSDEMEIERATVTKHVPFPPHKTKGYVASEEENPLKKGPTGHNPW
jgi:hypothetical protein